MKLTRFQDGMVCSVLQQKHLVILLCLVFERRHEALSGKGNIMMLKHELSRMKWCVSDGQMLTHLQAGMVGSVAGGKHGCFTDCSDGLGV